MSCANCFARRSLRPASKEFALVELYPEFVIADQRVLLEQEVQLVDPLCDAMRRKWVEREFETAVALDLDRSGRNIDMNRVVRVAVQKCHDLWLKRDREQAVLERIAMKNIRKLAADDGSYSHVQ